MSSGVIVGYDGSEHAKAAVRVAADRPVLVVPNGDRG
jgi:hypothetical protein